MYPTKAMPHTLPFDEDEWLRLLFLLNDTQHWLNDMATRAVLQLPAKDLKRLYRKTYYLGVQALAHIVERHYYKVMRHPATGKFTIPIAGIVACLRDAATIEPQPIPGRLEYMRVLERNEPIGYDRNGIPTCRVTIITDSAGRIVTAYPGE